MLSNQINLINKDNEEFLDSLTIQKSKYESIQNELNSLRRNYEIPEVTEENDDKNGSTIIIPTENDQKTLSNSPNNQNFNINEINKDMKREYDSPTFTPVKHESMISRS